MSTADMILIHSGDYANWVFDPEHPTQGRRFINARSELLDLAYANNLDITEDEPSKASRYTLQRVHTSQYVSDVLDHGRCSEWDGQRFKLASLAQLFVGGTLLALEHLIEGNTLTAVNFPGAKHHAQWDRSSGFCVFNDFAIAADIATKEHGLTVAILDIDAHHGDGTENLTRLNGNVLTYSIHEYGNFPFSGFDDDPRHLVYNLPLIPESGDRRLHLGVQDFISLAQGFDLIFIAAGADGHKTDPLSTLNYTVKGYTKAARMVREAFPATPILIGGAGGYQPDDYTPEVWANVAAAIAAPVKAPTYH